jgi:hypothetical protein
MSLLSVYAWPALWPTINASFSGLRGPTVEADAVWAAHRQPLIIWDVRWQCDPRVRSKSAHVRRIASP